MAFRFGAAALVFSTAASLVAATEPAPAATPAAPLQAVRARPLTAAVFDRTPARVERGRYLANAVIGCVICHSERDTSAPGAPPRAGREFAGSVLFDEPDYRLVAPNLTPDSETGAGTWSDDMLARAIREGVGHDGRGIGGQMWWWAFRALSDEDLASIVVYLRSLPPVRNALPARILSPEIEKERAEAAAPLERPVAARDLADPLTRGRYLLEIADCGGCHSAWEGDPNPGIFAGGNAVKRQSGVAFSANLTPDPSALGGWSEEIFIGRMRSGRGGALSSTMPWIAYRQMTDDDLRAIYQMLRLAPPVRHWVDNLSPATTCVVCGQKHGLGEMNVAPVIERATVDLGPLDAYVGSYRIDDYTVTISARDGSLFASESWIDSPAGPAIELIPIAGGRFHGRGLPQVAFERNEASAVTALVAFELGPTRLERVP